MSSALAIELETGMGDQVKPRRVPKFLQALQDMTAEMALPYAFAEYLRLAKLPITIHGDTSAWNSTGKGALLIGDHRNGLEYFFLLAAFGQEGRKDIKIIGKPYALSVRLAEALDMHHEGYILPVIPATLASNRLNIFNRDIWMRVFNANTLSTQKEAKAINVTALKNAASCLAHGYAVAVFPTGGVKKATTSAWYRGVGELIKLLPETAGSTDPQVITERLRLRYVQDFHPHH